jgi:hypothetical protein
MQLVPAKFCPSRRANRSAVPGVKILKLCVPDPKHKSVHPYAICVDRKALFLESTRQSENLLPQAPNA